MELSFFTRPRTTEQGFLEVLSHRTNRASVQIDAEVPPEKSGHCGKRLPLARNFEYWELVFACFESWEGYARLEAIDGWHCDGVWRHGEHGFEIGSRSLREKANVRRPESAYDLKAISSFRS